MKYKVEYYSDYHDDWQIDEGFNSLDEAIEYAKREIARGSDVSHRVVQEVWNSDDIT